MQMIPQDNFSNQEDRGANDQDREQDVNNADAAKYNADEFERSIASRDVAKTKNTGSNADEVRFNKEAQEKAVNQRQSDEAGNKTSTQQPLTTQGSEKEIEENMGGTTNLSLDQLKKEGDPEGTNNK